jgi:uncharacterized protein (DUF1684 family)
MNFDNYYDEIDGWRQKMEQSLRAEDSWLALAGLFWLREGRNLVGSDPSCNVLLPMRRSPEHIGDIELNGDNATFHVTSEVPITMDGEIVKEAVLLPDVLGSPTVLRLGKLTMMLLKRGDRFAIRLWDNERPQRTEFQGRKWYPIQDSYRLRAQLTPYEPVRRIPFPNELGEVEEIEVVGYVRFSLQGQDCQLDAMEIGNRRLRIIFKDQTSGQQTYPPGRYLMAEAPEEERVVLVDFNRAYNPPCAFTPYATCTLPPPQNHLPVLVEAGERYR